MEDFSQPRVVDIRDHSFSSASHASQCSSTGSFCGASGTHSDVMMKEHLLRNMGPKIADEPPVTVSACKYFFDPAFMKWRTETIRLCVPHPNRGVSQDDLHAFFAVELEEGDRWIPMLAKVFRRCIADVSEMDYFGEGQCQSMGELLVSHFNRLRIPGKERPDFPLLTNRCVARILPETIPHPDPSKPAKGFFSYYTEDFRALLVVLEPNCAAAETNIPVLGNVPRLPDSMSKSETYQLAEAFSHFTYVKSGYGMLVHGMCRKNGILLDPLVHTLNQKGFGIRNSGLKGIKRWVENHCCNSVCKSLMLDPLPVEAKSAAETTGRYYIEMAEKINDCHGLVGQRFVLPHKDHLAPTSRHKPLDPQSKEVVNLIAKGPTTSVRPLTCSATKLMYDTNNSRWTTTRTVVRVPHPDQPVKRTDRYTFFEMQEGIGTSHCVRGMGVVIMNGTSGATEKDYIDECSAYCMRSECTRRYNERARLKGVTEMAFHSCVVISISMLKSAGNGNSESSCFASNRSTDTNSVLCLMVSQDSPGTILSRGHTPAMLEAFSHFTLTESAGCLLVSSEGSDLTGMGPPVWVSTSDCAGFGQSNRGPRAMKLWSEKHICNDVCARMGLVPLSAGSLTVTKDALEHNVYALWARRLQEYGDKKAFSSSVSSMSAAQLSHRAQSTTSADASPTLNSSGSSTPRCSGRLVPLSVLAEGVKPNDDSAVSLKATKYVFDIDTLSWKESPMMLHVLHPNRGLNQGGMRACFQVAELVSRDQGIPMIAKVFRHHIRDVTDQDYFGEGVAQHLSQIFCDRFVAKDTCEKSVAKSPISFLVCSVVRIRRDDIPSELYGKRSGFFAYKTQDSGDTLCIVEPMLRGHFTKYNGNFGETYPHNEKRAPFGDSRQRINIFETCEAFSHFTLVESGGSMLVCDLQGVNEFLTDPQIHTEDGKGLGLGNMGRKGMEKFKKCHRCNRVCKALALPSVEGVLDGAVGTGAAPNYFAELVRKLRL